MDTLVAVRPGCYLDLHRLNGARKSTRRYDPDASCKDEAILLTQNTGLT